MPVMHVRELMAMRAARGQPSAQTPGFVPRFVASTVLALIAWGLEQSPSPSAAELQTAYRALIGPALGGG